MRFAATTQFWPAWAVCALCLATACTGQATPPVDSLPPVPVSLVDKIEIRDTIQPISAGRLLQAVKQAEGDRAAALLIELDTPGGLVTSTRDIVGAILASKVPVIVYVTPAGVRAASAGFFILESADIAAMAPGTNTGAAHPVLSSGTPDPTMKMKMENDAAAFLRSYSLRRGRNVALAESAVRESKSFTADEALDQHLIDLVSPDETHLLASLDSRVVKRPNPDDPSHPIALTLRLRNPRIVSIEPTLRDRILGYLADPNIALMMLVVGALLIYLEFNVPGTIVPGALGTVLVLLAAFAFNLLPLRGTAVMLLAASLVLLILELKFPSHGILALAGTVAMAFGALTLVDAPIPEMAIRPALALGLCLAFGILTFLLLRVALVARRNKSSYGANALVGSTGVAMEPLFSAHTMPRGRILVEGEIWQATTTHAPLHAEAAVRVIGCQGDVLEVLPAYEPDPDSASALSSLSLTR